jgi:hypothetical protein
MIITTGIESRLYPYSCYYMDRIMNERSTVDIIVHLW